MGLLVARDRLPEQQRQEGVVICSADAHVSLLKATRVMGLRGDGLQRLPVDDDGCMAPEALEQSLRDLQEQGRSCIAVVATAGTTVRGAVDPLTAMAAICRGHNVWLHVDAAIGSVFAAETTTVLMDGIALADSIMNPQKLLGITKASSLLLLRDPSLLRPPSPRDCPTWTRPLVITMAARRVFRALGRRKFSSSGLACVSLVRQGLSSCCRLPSIVATASAGVLMPRGWMC